MVIMTKRSKDTALILLDRDGVFNDNAKSHVQNYSEFKLVPNLSKSLQKLGRENFMIGVVTNQPDISRGLLSNKDLKKMNNTLTGVAVKAGIKKDHFTIKFCPHTKQDGCECRKPRTGLIKQVLRQFRLRANKLRFYLVGDKYRDIQTMDNYYHQTLKPFKVPRGKVTTILLEWKYAESSESSRLMVDGDAKIIPDFKLKSLDSAINLIIKLEKAK